MEIEVINNEIIITVEKDIYNIDTLHKCFYWYGANFIVDISSKSEKLFQIKLQPKNNDDIASSLSTLSEKIKRDIIDFKLRDIVTKETQNVRELLTAKAFAYYDVDENPTTEVGDPVGFNPDEVR